MKKFLLMSTCLLSAAKVSSDAKTDWVTITPDLQYIINPSGFGTIPNAFVIGAQIDLIL